MINQISFITVLVRDQDEALEYYTQKLGFKVLQDVTAGNGFRWLAVAPPGSKGASLALLKAESEEELKTVGKQTGGRIPLFVYTTDDCQKTYQELLARGVEFIDTPMENPWGTAVQFYDLYGNKCDLLRPRPQA